jgi:tetrahydromethanopterin S-methyltransferase subunit G
MCKGEENISFAPRLQSLPEVVVHPRVQGAMQKRLQSIQRTFQSLTTKNAQRIAAALA